MSPSEDYKDPLKGMGDVIGSAIVSRTGSLIASYFDQDINEALMSEITAKIYTVSEKAVIELSHGVLRRIFVEYEYGNLILSKIGENLILYIFTKPRLSLKKLCQTNRELEKFLVQKVEKVIRKIRSLKKGEKVLSIEKKYLLDIFSKDLLNFDTPEGLPILNDFVEEQFNLEGITITNKYTRLIFFKDE